jgi:putative tryptophan/tyrosine transport system substrate-binding protein
MDIGRRTCLAAALALVGTAPRAQTSKQPARIGFVTAFPDASATRQSGVFSALQDGLRAQGLVEGRDYAWELRFHGGRPERMEALYQELADAHIDVLIAGVCGAPLEAARRASTSIPIVVPTCNDDLVDLGA